VDLLTIRGSEVLRIAEVVVYDYLVNPDLLRFAPASDELIFAGRRVAQKSGSIRRKSTGC
jgi:siroheme synthase